MIEYIIVKIIPTQKIFNDFKNGLELFRKIKSDQIKLEDVRELQNIFKINLNYLMDHILFQILKIILNIYLKSMEKNS